MHFKALAGWFLASACFLPFVAESNDLEFFDNYQQWGVNIGAHVYSMPEINREYGSMDIHPRLQYGTRWGGQYNFVPVNRWYIIAGLNLIYFPVAWFDYTIVEEDIPATWGPESGGVSPPRKITRMPVYSPSVSLIASYKTKINERFFFNMGLGNESLYFPPALFHWSDPIGECLECKPIEVFDALGFSSKSIIKGSFILTTGVYIVFDNFLLRSNLKFLYSYEDLVTGEYYFTNLLESEPSGGTFRLKGSYIGLSLTAFISREWKLTFVE